VLEYAAVRGWDVVAEAEWADLKAALPDVSETTIRTSIMNSAISIAQPWRGVGQHTLDDLESSLREITAVYASRPDLRRYCREQVIGAKDRARAASLSARVDAGKRALKAEMVEWMLVWLGDPSMFPSWASMRREGWP
jgi:hypothetical protein